MLTAAQIGDTTSQDDAGDLGSDGGTAVRASSNGDLALTPSDFWSVTSDHSGGATNSDLALAHVMDGPGGRERVDVATTSATVANTGDPNDNLAWRWDSLKIQPGQTLALVSYEAPQGVAGSNAAAEDAAAAGVAASYQSAAPASLFAGMTKSEQAAVANWATPVKCLGRAVTIAGSDAKDKITGTKKKDVIYAGGGKDKIKGKGGNDRICGAAGKDKMIGGGGRNDRFKGGPGKDTEKQ